MVGIIKKVENAEDFEKMQRSIELIYGKSKEYFDEIRITALDILKC